MGFPGGISGQEPACQQSRRRRRVRSLGQEGPLEKEMATHSNSPFFPGESHGQGSLVGYSPGGRHETDTTEGLSASPGGTVAPAFAGGDNLPG